MRKLRYRTKIDLGVSLATVLAGLFFFSQASLIDTLSDDFVGPQFFPYALSFITVGIGLFIGASAMYHASSLGPLAEEDTSRDEEKFGFRDSSISRITSVIAVGLLYVGLFYATGYLLATAVSLFLMLVAFGNRSWLTLLVISVAGALFYNFVFIGLMGVYNPPGVFLDLENFLAEIF